MNIPVIDFAPFTEGSSNALNRLAYDVDAALTTYGFIAVRNIGIENALLDKTFRSLEHFFAQPMDSKRPFAYTDPKANFGYQAPLSESLQPGQPADIKEAFTMRDLMRHYQNASDWPSKAFRENARDFFYACMQAAFRMLRVFATALDMPADFFIRMHSGENITMRYLHYPQRGFSVDPAQMGAGAHTDYGALTLLFQDSVGGLQLRQENGDWMDVPPISGAVNINTGDLMTHWSNGRYPSTEHRVLPRIGHGDRHSIAFFTDPDSETRVECLPSCVNEENPARFPPTTAGEHIQAKIDASQSMELAAWGNV